MQVKRISQLRMNKAISDRETLMPCQACSGNGYRVADDDHGRYRRFFCKWCDGTGLAAKAVTQMFKRAKRISSFMRKVS